MRKKIIYVSFACCVLAPWLTFGAPAPAAAVPAAEPTEEPLNRIVAVVNDQIIPESELDVAIDQTKQELNAQNVPIPSEAKLRQDVLDQLINYHLQMQMVERFKVEVTDAELDASIQQIADSHHISMDQLKQQLTLQNTTYSAFRKKIRDQMVISKLQQQAVMGQVKVTDADLAAFKKKYESEQQNLEYHLLDFLVRLPEKPSKKDVDDALNTARQIQQQLDSGVAPEQIKLSYIDLDWRSAADLPQLFLTQLPKLTLQNASPPLRAPNGYHVLKLVATRNKGAELTEDQLRQLAFREKYSEAVKVWVNKMRSEAYVQIIPE